MQFNNASKHVMDYVGVYQEWLGPSVRELLSTTPINNYGSGKYSRSSDAAAGEPSTYGTTTGTSTSAVRVPGMVRCGHWLLIKQAGVFVHLDGERRKPRL